MHTPRGIVVIGDYEIPRPGEGPKPGEGWTLTFNGASNAPGHEIEVVLTSSKNFHKLYTARLYFLLHQQYC